MRQDILVGSFFSDKAQGVERFAKLLELFYLFC